MTGISSIKLADRIYVLNSDGTTAYEGRYDDYLAKRKEDADTFRNRLHLLQNVIPVINDAEKKRPNSRNSVLRFPAWKNRFRRRKKRLDLVEAALNAPETVSDYQATLELSDQLARLNAQNDDQLAQWAELSEAVESAQEELSLIL